MVLLLAFVTAIIAIIRIPGLEESSGLAASRRHPGILWTMNDDSGPILFAFDRKGKLKARVTVRSARTLDWEGLSSGPGPTRGRSYLYIGDIGDNLKRRKSITVYRMEEPDVLRSGTKSSGCIRAHIPRRSARRRSLVGAPPER